MVSDWQGGDISKLFPALSGKEDLSMGEDKKADKKRKRIVPKAPVQMIISREDVGTQTVTVKRHFTANSNITFFLRDLPVLRQFIAKKSFFYYGKITLFLKKRRPFQVLSA